MRLRVNGEAFDGLFGGKEVALTVGQQQFVGGFGEAQFGGIQAGADLFGELFGVERLAGDGEVAFAEQRFVPRGGVRFFQVRRVDDEAGVIERQVGEAGEGVGGRLVRFFLVEIEFEQAARCKERGGFEFGDKGVDAGVAVEALAFAEAVGSGTRAQGVQRFGVQQCFATVDEADGRQRVRFQVVSGVLRGEVHRMVALR